MGLQRTANEYAEERRIYKDLISKNNNVDILNMSKKQYLLGQNFQERIGYTCANCFLHRLWQARNARMMGYERGTRVQSDRKEQNTYLYRQVFDFYYLKSHLINLSVSH